MIDFTKCKEDDTRTYGGVLKALQVNKNLLGDQK